MCVFLCVGFFVLNCIFLFLFLFIDVWLLGCVWSVVICVACFVRLSLLAGLFWFTFVSSSRQLWKLFLFCVLVWLLGGFCIVCWCVWGDAFFHVVERPFYGFVGFGAFLRGFILVCFRYLVIFVCLGVALCFFFVVVFLCQRIDVFCCWF